MALTDRDSISAASSNHGDFEGDEAFYRELGTTINRTYESGQTIDHDQVDVVAEMIQLDDQIDASEVLEDAERVSEGKNAAPLHCTAESGSIVHFQDSSGVAVIDGDKNTMNFDFQHWHGPSIGPTIEEESDPHVLRVKEEHEDYGINLSLSLRGTSIDLVSDDVEAHISEVQEAEQNVAIEAIGTDSDSKQTANLSAHTDGPGAEPLLTKKLFLIKSSERASKATEDLLTYSLAVQAANSARWRANQSEVTPCDAADLTPNDVILSNRPQEATIMEQHTQRSVDTSSAEEQGQVDPDCSDKVEDPAKSAMIFLEVKRNYVARFQTGLATAEEALAFIEAEDREKIRMKILQRQEEQAQYQIQLEQEMARAKSIEEDAESVGSSGNGLFLSIRKRPREETVHRNPNLDDRDKEDIENIQDLPVTAHPNKRPRKQPSKPKRTVVMDSISTKEAQAAALANLEDELHNGAKKAAREAAKAKRAAEGGPNKPPRARKRKEKAAKAKKRPYQGLEMSNINSLFSTDVIADAQANNHKPEQPKFTNTVTGVALKELVTATPIESRRKALMDKNALLRASQSLKRRGAIRTDPESGGWIVKGMITSLYHYQLLGFHFMLDRENSMESPSGGILADETGFGKTVMMIACMVGSQAAPTDGIRTTLVVATPPLVSQWMEELKRHCTADVLADVIKYKSSADSDSNNIQRTLELQDVVCTTYQEVAKSWPKYDPPVELVTDEEKVEWWSQKVEECKGPLHRIHWHRVVLDEAHAIKNHTSRTSRGCCALMAKHRWAVSGTPIQNRISEIFPYFKFLHIDHSGSFEIFKKHYCERGSTIAGDRLTSILGKIMIRRTHSDMMFGAPILKLPNSHELTTYVHFNKVERAVYEFVRQRFIERINGLSADGRLESQYRGVLTLLLRLRQMTGHIFSVAQCCHDLLSEEDVANLSEMVENFSDEDEPDTNMLRQLRTVLKEQAGAPSRTIDTSQKPSNNESAQVTVDTGGEFGAYVVNFSKYLDLLRQKSGREESNEKSLCQACKQPPENPWITSCQHVYCYECLSSMQQAAAAEGWRRAPCMICAVVFESAAQAQEVSNPNIEGSRGNKSSQREENSRKRGGVKKVDYVAKWVNHPGRLWPSAKTLAIKAQLLNWFEKAPDDKVIIFSQFKTMIKLIAQICELERWEYCEYHGDMSVKSREMALKNFNEIKGVKVLISSLKCGGVGLNLMRANRVINVDLWWNRSVENQAFCRVFRIGQTRETHLSRLVVKDSVDDALLEMQEQKQILIGKALGDDKEVPDDLSIYDLLPLFGRVESDDQGRRFIVANSGKKDDEADDLTG